MRRIKLLSLIICIAFMLFGCSLKGEKSYQGTMKIPDNGIISESVIKQIKNDNAVVTFTGCSGSIDYEWVVFGDDIPKADELNLGVVVEEKTAESVIFSYLSDDELGFTPVLSLYLDCKWDCRSAVIYNSRNEAVCGASVTGSKNSIINLTVTEKNGKYTIKPDSDDTDTIQIISQTTTSDNKTSTETTETKSESDPYLTPVSPDKPIAVSDGGNRVISDGTATEKDKYETDPVPDGKPMPVEPEDVNIDESKTYSCIFSIECSTILNNMSDLNPDKIDVLPSDGIILSAREVKFHEGESVYDVLQRVCRENNIHMEASWTPIYNSAYVEGINNLYEFDCGSLSGWMYRVNGWYPNYGCSRYQLVDGEVVEWRYTCDLGNDVGGGYAVGGT